MNRTTEDDKHGGSGAPKKPGMMRQSIVGSIGAFVEQFDYNLYGVFAVFFAAEFFPSDDPIVPLLQAFLIFALSFFLRPLGGILIGAYVDRKGRRAGLLLTVGMMTGGAVIITVVPNYATIGVLAPILLVIARSLQGLAAGGEVGTAMPFLSEIAPRERRGTWSSMHGVSTGMSLLVAAILAAVLVNVLSDAQMESWGWRIAFGFSALMGVVALVIRRDVEETEAFKASSAEQHTEGPLTRLFRYEWRSVVMVILVTIAPLTYFYFWMSYLPTFTEVFGGLDVSATRTWTVVALILFIVAAPFGGYFSDRLGRRSMLFVFVSGCMILVPFTVIMLSGSPSVAVFAILQCLGALFTGIEVGVRTAVLSEQFSRSVRGAGVGLGYSVAAALFGGSAPYIATWLTGDDRPNLLIIYLLLAGAASFIAYVRLPETRGVDLNAARVVTVAER